MPATENVCPFCHPETLEIVAENALALAVRDHAPVRPLHTLILPRRHVADIFATTPAEREAIHTLAESCRQRLTTEDPSIRGFNYGSNIGHAAGQKIAHAHVHLIPRRPGEAALAAAQPDQAPAPPSEDAHTPFAIRPLHTDDYPTIIQVVDRWWGGRRMADMLPRLFFTHFAGTSLVAKRGEEIVGFLVGFISPEHPDTAYIHFVGVHPDYRAHGIARSLYRLFFKHVEQHGCQQVQCVTAPINQTSLAFHQRLGFVAAPGPALHSGVPYTPDYDGPGEHRVLLCKTFASQP